MAEIDKLNSSIRELTSTIDNFNKTYKTMGMSSNEMLGETVETAKEFEGISKKIKETFKEYGADIKSSLNIFEKLTLSAQNFNAGLSQTVNIVKSLIIPGGALAALGLGVEALTNAQTRAIENVREYRREYATLYREIGNVSAYNSALKVTKDLNGTFLSLGMSVGDSRSFVDQFSKSMKTFSESALKPASREAIDFAFNLGLGTNAASDLVGYMYRFGASITDIGKQNKILRESEQFFYKMGVSTGAVGREMAKMPDMIARFGGPTNLAYLSRVQAQFMRFNMDLKSATSSFEKFDTIAGSAEFAAKMNRMFGTSFTSLELMLRTNPEERLELIVEQLRGQGLAYDQLDYAQKKFLRTTTDLDDAQLQMLLDSKNYYMSTAEIMGNINRKKQIEISDEKKRQDMMKYTSTLAYDVSVTLRSLYDQIGKFFKPLFDSLFHSQKNLFGGLIDFFKAMNDEKLAKAKGLKGIRTTFVGIRDGLTWIVTTGSKLIGEFIGNTMTDTNYAINFILSGVKSISTGWKGIFNVPIVQYFSGLIKPLDVVWKHPTFAMLGALTGGKIGGVFGTAGKVLGGGLGTLFGGIAGEAYKKTQEQIGEQSITFGTRMTMFFTNFKDSLNNFIGKVSAWFTSDAPEKILEIAKSFIKDMFGNLKFAIESDTWKVVKGQLKDTFIFIIQQLRPFFNETVIPEIKSWITSEGAKELGGLAIDLVKGIFNISKDVISATLGINANAALTGAAAGGIMGAVLGFTAIGPGGILPGAKLGSVVGATLGAGAFALGESLATSGWKESAEKSAMLSQTMKILSGQLKGRKTSDYSAWEEDKKRNPAFANLSEKKLSLMYANEMGISPYELGGMARGGIATKPSMVIVGERGPEVIMPMNQLVDNGKNMTPLPDNINPNITIYPEFKGKVVITKEGSELIAKMVIDEVIS